MSLFFSIVSDALMQLSHLGLNSDVFIVVATGPRYLQPFMKCHYHFLHIVGLVTF